MIIRRVEKFEVNGQSFDSRKKAEDYIEELTVRRMDKIFRESGYPMGSFIQFMEKFLENKAFFADVLNIEFDDDF